MRHTFLRHLSCELRRLASARRLGRLALRLAAAGLRVLAAAVELSTAISSVEEDSGGPTSVCFKQRTIGFNNSSPIGTE